MEVSRRVSWPGAWRRPLDLALVTLPVTSSPERAIVLPSLTRSRASVPRQVSPACAVPELRVDPNRTVTCVPAGIDEAAPHEVDSIKAASAISRFIQRSSFQPRRDPILTDSSFCYNFRGKSEVLCGVGLWCCVWCY